MRTKFITLLLLSYSLLADAGDSNTLSSVTKEEFKPAEMQLAMAVHTQQQEEDELVDELDESGQDDEIALVEPQLSSVSGADKARSELYKIMPQLAYGAHNVKPRIVSDSAASNTRLDSEFLKNAAMPRMRSSIVLIYDENADQILHSKNADVVAPIASITKLMTAMIVLDAKLPLDEEISILPEDISKEKRTRSRTRTGMTLTRGELLKLALMASDNLSAAALARTYPGGTEAALRQMNAKARELGMDSSRFMDPTGLHSGNVATANDLVKMVRAAHGYELIHQFSTSTSHTVEQAGRRPVRFHNTNPLVRNASWDIGLSKTGYISEAGRCLVMEAKITEQPVIIVLLDSWGKNSRVGDANRVKKWMEKASLHETRGSRSRNL